MRVAVATPVHLATHAEYLRAAGQSPRTITARVDVITRLARHLGTPLPLATTQHLAAFLAHPSWTRATRAAYRYHIRGYFGWLHLTGVIDIDPSRTLAVVRVPKPPPRPITDGVLKQILTRAKDPYQRYYLLAAYAGLRCQEIATLTTYQVNADLIKVLGKGDKTRYVDTHPVVWESVSRLPPGPVFHLWSPDTPVEYLATKMSRASNDRLMRLGFRDVSMHMLRHWFGTTAYRLTHDLRAVQELLGHTSIASTQRYTKVSSEERRLVVRALPTVA